MHSLCFVLCLERFEETPTRNNTSDEDGFVDDALTRVSMRGVRENDDDDGGGGEVPRGV